MRFMITYRTLKNLYPVRDYMPLEQIETTIQSLSHDGRGITTLNDKTTFVSGALPSEKVICKIIRKHRRYNEAEVIDVITKAPERTDPLCAHYGVCGGCSMQHVEIKAQVQLKQQALLDQLKHFGKVTPEEIFRLLWVIPGDIVAKRV